MVIKNETLLDIADDFEDIEVNPKRKPRKRNKKNLQTPSKKQKVIDAAEARKNGGRSKLTVASEELVAAQKKQEVALTKKELSQKAYQEKKQNMDFLGRLTIDQWNDPNVQKVIRERFPQAAQNMSKLRDNSLKWKKAADHFARQPKGAKISKGDRIQAESIGMIPEEYQNPILAFGKGVFDIVKQSAIDTGISGQNQFTGYAKTQVANEEKKITAKTAAEEFKFKREKFEFEKDKFKQEMAAEKDKNDSNLAKFNLSSFINNGLKDGIFTNIAEAKAAAKEILLDKDFYGASEKKAKNMLDNVGIYKHSDGQTYPTIVKNGKEYAVINGNAYPVDELKKAKKTNVPNNIQVPSIGQEQIKSQNFGAL